MKKKEPFLYLDAALVPPSAGSSGAVASGCLPDGPQAQGPLKGVNAIFEQGMGTMPARPRVWTNGQRETMELQSCEGGRVAMRRKR